MSTGAGWRPTGALVRATAVAAVTTLGALAFGRTDLLVLAAPFGLLCALGVGHAARGGVRGHAGLAHPCVREGQSTVLVVTAETDDPVEQATVTLSRPAYVVTDPASAVVSTSATPVRMELSISPRRWGVRPVGTALLAVGSRWGGFRWGPHRLPEQTLTALPEAAVFSATESPQPLGLVGRNRSRRPGHGSEFWGVRPFQPGDRLRRVDWRTTLRTRVLHAVGTDALEDSSVLLLLDAVADVGASDGVDGSASSLDVGVRAAAAVAAHHVRVGDRVALRVLGRTPFVLGPGSGVRHQRRMEELLARVRPGWPEAPVTRLRLRADAGTVVTVLSPLFVPEVMTTMVSLATRGLTVVAIDTLPPDALPEPARDPGSAARLAWRMRLLERRMQVEEVTRLGIPVVPWAGPGTLDEVLRRLARRPHQRRGATL